MERLNISRGDNSPMSKRISAIERFLVPYKPCYLNLRDIFGEPKRYHLLAGVPMPLVDDERGPHPFNLVTRRIDGKDHWRVIYLGSSITDGTNGAAVDLTLVGFNADNPITETKYIVLEADVDPDLVVTNWALVEVAPGDEANLEEVGMSDDDSTIQGKLRLLIGKVTIEPDKPINVAEAVFTAQRITHGFLNGIMVKVFESAPVNIADL